MKIKCKTLFDISFTGVTGRFRPSTLPFVDKTGQEITNLDSWNIARNKQRNYETLIQLISLRTQPIDLSLPESSNGCYEFTFVVETTAAFLDNNDDLALLKQDCEGVPMLIKLGEKGDLSPKLQLSGPSANIWFEKIE